VGGLGGLSVRRDAAAQRSLLAEDLEWVGETIPFLIDNGNNVTSWCDVECLLVESRGRAQVAVVEVPEQGRFGSPVHRLEHSPAPLLRQVHGNVETSPNVWIDESDGARRTFDARNSLAIVTERRQGPVVGMTFPVVELLLR